MHSVTVPPSNALPKLETPTSTILSTFSTTAKSALKLTSLSASAKRPSLRTSTAEPYSTAVGKYSAIASMAASVAARCSVP